MRESVFDLDPELVRFAERVAEAATSIVRGLVLLRLTAPGVPDLYNGGRSSR